MVFTMGDIIPETGTEVTVNIDPSGLDQLINVIQGDKILSEVLAPAVDQLQKDKDTLKDSATNLANVIAERIKSYQEQFISMNQSIVTGNMHDTIFVDPQGDGEAEVGATALSEKGFPYPIVVEKGSDPHEIENAFGRGITVQHPGTSPKPFVGPSLDYIKQDVDELCGSEVTSKLGE
jgi:hypothetical protein